MKKDTLEFWFYQWMIEDKKISFNEYCMKSEEEISRLHDEFIKYYQSIN